MSQWWRITPLPVPMGASANVYRCGVCGADDVNRRTHQRETGHATFTGRHRPTEEVTCMYCAARFSKRHTDSTRACSKLCEQRLGAWDRWVGWGWVDTREVPYTDRIAPTLRPLPPTGPTMRQAAELFQLALAQMTATRHQCALCLTRGARFRMMVQAYICTPCWRTVTRGWKVPA